MIKVKHRTNKDQSMHRFVAYYKDGMEVIRDILVEYHNAVLPSLDKFFYALNKEFTSNDGNNDIKNRVRSITRYEERMGVPSAMTVIGSFDNMFKQEVKYEKSEIYNSLLTDMKIIISKVADEQPDLPIVFKNEAFYENLIHTFIKFSAERQKNLLENFTWAQFQGFESPDRAQEFANVKVNIFGSSSINKHSNDTMTYVFNREIAEEGKLASSLGLDTLINIFSISEMCAHVLPSDAGISIDRKSDYVYDVKDFLVKYLDNAVKSGSADKIKDIKNSIFLTITAKKLRVFNYSGFFRDMSGLFLADKSTSKRYLEPIVHMPKLLIMFKVYYNMINGIELNKRAYLNLKLNDTEHQDPESNTIYILIKQMIEQYEGAIELFGKFDAIKATLPTILVNYCSKKVYEKKPYIDKIINSYANKESNLINTRDGLVLTNEYLTPTDALEMFRPETISNESVLRDISNKFNKQITIESLFSTEIKEIKMEGAKDDNVNYLSEREIVLKMDSSCRSNYLKYKSEINVIDAQIIDIEDMTKKKSFLSKLEYVKSKINIELARMEKLGSEKTRGEIMYEVGLIDLTTRADEVLTRLAQLDINAMRKQSLYGRLEI